MFRRNFPAWRRHSTVKNICHTAWHYSTLDRVHSVKWYDMIWYMIFIIYDTIYDIWYGIYIWWYMIWYDMIWYDIRYDMVWFDMVWYDIYDIIWYMIRYGMIYLVNCNWVDTRWQYTFTHKQYTEQHNETEYTEQNIITRIHKHNNNNT
jgi:hypothetical protein